METIARQIFLILLLIVASTPRAFAENSPLTLAIHPYLPVPEIEKRFSPLINYLSAVLGRPVQIRIGRNYDEHIAAIGRDQVDIAFLGPAGYVAVVDKYKEKPILGSFIVGNKAHLYGVIATRTDSKLQNLRQLRDANFAFGDHRSTMSYLVPRYMLIEAGINKGLPDNHQFLGTHKNVALGILVGDYDAGAMKKEVFDSYKDQGLRALATTPGVPDHLFVARSNLPAKELARLKKAMQAINTHGDGDKILKSMHKNLSRLAAAVSDDYRQLRIINTAVQAAGQ